MKIKKRSILVLLLSLFMVGALSTSCKKDDVEDKEEEEDQPIEKFFKVKIDNNTEITFTRVSRRVLGGRLTLRGSDSSENIEIQFPNSVVTTGTTTDFDPSYFRSSQGEVFINVTGKTVNITIYDTSAKRIAGTYTVHYDHNGTHTATGSFDIVY